MFKYVFLLDRPMFSWDDPSHLVDCSLSFHKKCSSKCLCSVDPKNRDASQEVLLLDARAAFESSNVDWIDDYFGRVGRQLTVISFDVIFS
jgi:hypothetical protein